jgi:hypothetical protein
MPGQGKIAGLPPPPLPASRLPPRCCVLREFGATDREKFAKILKLRRRA